MFSDSDQHRPETSTPMSPQSPQTVGPRSKSEKPESRPPASKKRTSTNAGAGDEPPAKTAKRRATRACGTCRSRKVRCDVTEQHPCSNCKWDGADCIVQDSRRRKKNIPPTGPVYAPVVRNAPIASAVSLAGGGFAPNPIPAAAPFPFNDGHIAPAMYAPFMSRQPVLAQGQQLRQQQLAEMNVAAYGPKQGFNLPTFIKSPDLGRIGVEDLEYLQRKGCFELPPGPLRRKLLRAYIEHVHPMLPVLDLHWFLRLIDPKNPQPVPTDDRGNPLQGFGISLLLFQAVMFSACTFVHPQDLQDAGFPTRMQARLFLFNKVKLLESLDYEQDRIVLIQSLLLMSFWYSTPTETKDTWHYTGIAISIAHTINLHRDPGNQPNVSPQKAKLQRRLWWCCLTRDRLIALGMRRPTRVRDEDYSVPKPTIDDFEFLPVDNDAVDPECDVLRKPELQRCLALNFVELVKLSELVFQMLKTQYSTLPSGPHLVSPRDKVDQETQKTVLDLDAALEKWRNELPVWQREKPLSNEDVERGHTHLAMVTNHFLLNMLWMTTKAALWRPFYAIDIRLAAGGHPAVTNSISQSLQNRAKGIVPLLAAQVTRMAGDLRDYGLVRLLPTVAVTAILPTLLIHMLGFKSTDGAVRSQSVQGYNTIKEVLTELAEVYVAAKYGVEMSGGLLLKAGVADFAPLDASRQPTMPINSFTPMGYNTGLTPPPENSFVNPADMSMKQIPMHGLQRPLDHDTPPSSGEETPVWNRPDVAIDDALTGWSDDFGNGQGEDLGTDIMDQFINFPPGGEGPVESMSMMQGMGYLEHNP
ncbi:hypothetical protein OQA88_1877 [Cercophora sp. LCS_1]